MGAVWVWGRHCVTEAPLSHIWCFAVTASFLYQPFQSKQLAPRCIAPHGLSSTQMGLLEAAADLRGAVEAEKKERSAARKQRATDAAAEVADPERRSSRAKKAVERLGEFATGEVAGMRQW